jgi:hypothetical protein
LAASLRQSLNDDVPTRDSATQTSVPLPSRDNVPLPSRDNYVPLNPENLDAHDRARGVPESRSRGGTPKSDDSRESVMSIGSALNTLNGRIGRPSTTARWLSNLAMMREIDPEDPAVLRLEAQLIEQATALKRQLQQSLARSANKDMELMKYCPYWQYKGKSRRQCTHDVRPTDAQGFCEYHREKWNREHDIVEPISPGDRDALDAARAGMGLARRDS